MGRRNTHKRRRIYHNWVEARIFDGRRRGDVIGRGNLGLSTEEGSVSYICLSLLQL